jgi:hypothetical protein
MHLHKLVFIGQTNEDAVVGTAASLNIKSKILIREILCIKQAIDRTKLVFGHQVAHESSLDDECLSTVKPLCRAYSLPQPLGKV